MLVMHDNQNKLQLVDMTPSTYMASKYSTILTVYPYLWTAKNDSDISPAPSSHYLYVSLRLSNLLLIPRTEPPPDNLAATLET